MTSTDTRAGGVAAADNVAAFASAVRSHLDDLPADEVEDLVDGLEADLIERREDSDEPLGDPREYADELRAAAGLPPRREKPSGEWFGAYRRLGRNTSAWVREQRDNPVVTRVLDFLLALRPVRWVLRAWALFSVIVLFGAVTPRPDTGMGWVILAGFVIVSVQWGRDQWIPWEWLRLLKVAVSVIALIALPFTIGGMAHTVALASYGDSYASEVTAMESNPTSLNANGNPVTNVFAYDCDGNPLSGVQLFDQDGEPVEVTGRGPDDKWATGFDEEGVEYAIVPNPAANAGSSWNVFPLSRTDFGDDFEPDEDAVTEPEPPFAAVRPLAAGDGTCVADETDATPTEPTPADGAD